MPDAQCQTCKDCLDTAQAAVIRHIDCQSKLRMAVLRQDREAIPGLEAASEAARSARDQAVSELRAHLATHPAGAWRSAGR